MPVLLRESKHWKTASTLNKYKLIKEYLSKDFRDEPNMGITDKIKFTRSKEINNQLIVYFWWLICLTFVSQLIGYLIQFLSGTINANVLGILTLGAVNTLIIGGGVKLVQKQITKVTEEYNTSVNKNKKIAERNEFLEQELVSIKGELNTRDAELIAIKTRDAADSVIE